MLLKNMMRATSVTFIVLMSLVTAQAQIALPQGNVLNLNTSSDVLYLETRILFNTGIYKSEDYCWNKISDSLDSRWLVSSCFNGDCKNDLLASGCFIKDFGLNDSTCFLAFHVQTNSFNGTSVIKYNIYNKKNSADKTVLTFNIHYRNTTGVLVKNLPNQAIIAPNPSAESIVLRTIESVKDVEIQIRDVMGEIVIQQLYNDFSSETINISNLTEGVYFVNIIPVFPRNEKDVNIPVWSTLKFIKQ